MSYQLQSLFSFPNTPEQPEQPEQAEVLAERLEVDVKLNACAADPVQAEVAVDRDVAMPGHTDLAPMLQQYVNMKQRYAEHLLLFQVGDFYEVFFDDALIVAEILSIRLTSRDKGRPNPIPMCGVPIHAIDNYIPKLVDAGRSCVLVSQVEAEGGAKPGVKGGIRREVSRIITPGIRLEGDGVPDTQFNFLASLSVSPRGDEGCLSYVDASAGKLFIQRLESGDEVGEALARVRPSELLLPSTREGLTVDRLSEWFKMAKQTAETLPCRVLYRPFAAAPGREVAQRIQAMIPSKQLAEPAHGALESRETTASLQALLDYVGEVTFSGQVTLSNVEIRDAERKAVVDSVTRRNLELTEARIDGNKRQSLFAHINYTKTPMGARLLSEWLLNPSARLEEISARHDVVAELLEKDFERDELRKALMGVRDLDRLASRIGTLRASPHDLGLLRDSLADLPHIRERFAGLSSTRATQLLALCDPMTDIFELLSLALVAEPPVRLSEGPVIADAFHPDVAELRMLQTSGSDLLLELEARERQRTGIPGLKVKYNSVFGYFIEITKAHLAKTPMDYERRQTVANAERFVTPELKNHEARVLSAKSRLSEVERGLFSELREQLTHSLGRIQAVSTALAEIDVYCSFAMLAREQNYIRPELVREQILDVVAARHPVVEQVLGTQNFIPNDICLGKAKTGGDPSKSAQRRFGVLTGANMGGKSTYLRTIGLIQLLTQAGSFVPARRAIVGIADRIFTRIGAADDLARGDSTFMVEMRETALIVSRATDASLVLIDEIGRGTATQDGLALAQAIAEWLHDQVGCRTVFATHFHELTALPSRMPDAFCLSVGVLERGGEIVFTHRIEEKPASRSYGLEVARLAGLPDDLLNRAQQLLLQPQAGALMAPVESTAAVDPARAAGDASRTRLLEAFVELKLEALTPLQALNELARYQEAARGALLTDT